MGSHSINNILLIFLLAALLVGCSGGETGTGATDENGEQTLSVGTITGFGSVYVNSVKYDTSEADITINETSAQEIDLAVGMVVAVTGNVSADNSDEGFAKKIEYDSDVEGVVFSKSNNGSLNVMGQTIIHDNATVFDSNVETITDIASINQNAVVEVSGYPAGDGVVYATRLSLTSEQFNNTEVCVKGKITSPLTDTSFMIGDLVVRYDSAELKNFPNDQLAEGLLVKVIGHELDAQNQLIAEQVQFKKHIGVEQGMGVEMAGVVSNPRSLSEDFELNGILIQYDGDTQFISGDETSLVVGAIVKLQGEYVSEDTLYAHEIEITPSGKIDISAKIDLVNITDNSVSVLGETIYINNDTLMKDQTGRGKQKRFGIQYVNINDFVAIKAYQEGNKLIATQFKRRAINHQDNSARLVGQLQEVYTNGDNEITVSTFIVEISETDNAGLTAADIGKTLDVTGSYDMQNGFMATDFNFIE